MAFKQTFLCDFDGGTGNHGKVGVVLLSGDQTLENELTAERTDG